tara:strand:+ start:245 stop:604 length:360 start_codon:yes stop_codon:yes gene_type:complete
MSGFEINAMRKEIRILVITNLLVMFINVACFMVFIVIWLMGKGDPDPPLTPISDETIVKERSHLRGYYYKSEFAALMGVSEKTVDRWRESGKVPDMVDDQGRVMIPLSVSIDGERLDND